MTTTPLPHTHRIVGEWVDPWVDDTTEATARIHAAAESAFLTLDANTDGPRTDGPRTATVDLSPGNGHRYLMVVTALGKPADPFPGDLLVSLPEFNRCALLDGAGFHVPGYLDDKLGIGPDHAAVIAAFTTMLSELLYP